ALSEGAGSEGAASDDDVSDDAVSGDAVSGDSTSRPSAVGGSSGIAVKRPGGAVGGARSAIPADPAPAEVGADTPCARRAASLNTGAELGESEPGAAGWLGEAESDGSTVGWSEARWAGGWKGFTRAGGGEAFTPFAFSARASSRPNRPLHAILFLPADHKC
ncbi:MAG: hypothetical protein KDB20_11985, partial [Microthrixaceae bacterium]|nr:hypothetical protein [Microthrixaceae bacterium]